MLKPCVIQFAKTPQAGRVKTRMQPHLSAQESCLLHEALTDQVLSNLSSAKWAYHLFWSGADDSAWRERLSRQCMSDTTLAFHRQQGEDLGARMANAIAQGLREHTSVTIVGSDCPFLTHEHIAMSHSVLAAGHDVCFGPAEDGGYVLVAMRELHADLFTGVDWGTDRVLAQSLKAAEANGLSVALLPILSDIDRPEDLQKLQSFSWAERFLDIHDIVAKTSSP